MNALDYIIVAAYSIGLLGLGYYFKNQKDKKDYFLGGRSFGWFELGLSVMASQLSAISFISAAAFVGLREGGGMKWLSYEFAVPLAMIILMVVLIPPLYKMGIVSIYEFLENRFARSTRTLISLVFQFSRAFATGIMIYAVAIVLAVVLGIPVWGTILLAGVVTIVYSFQGGMKAVVWGDAIQMIIMVLGIIVCIFYGIKYIGGWGVFHELVDRDRLSAVSFGDFGIGDDGGFGFWPMLIGGLFLYTSYYGTDQSQAQRALSAKSMQTVRAMLTFNGLVRFPITFCYCLMGLVVGTFAFQNEEFMAMIPKETPDYMMPVFIANYLPHGIMGLLIVAILAAAMSSLSSAINSLSAASIEDIINRNRKEPLSTEAHLKTSKWLTVIWGVVCIVLAFSAGNIAQTVIEAINKVGSLFFGPILATFMLGIVTKKASSRGTNLGLITGVVFNLYLWLGVGDQLFWFWWNATGAIVTAVVGYVAGILSKSEKPHGVLDIGPFDFKIKESYILAVFFIVIVLFSISLPSIF